MKIKETKVEKWKRNIELILSFLILFWGGWEIAGYIHIHDMLLDTFQKIAGPSIIDFPAVKSSIIIMNFLKAISALAFAIIGLWVLLNWSGYIKKLLNSSEKNKRKS